jgi:hypothetical protein
VFVPTGEHWWARSYATVPTVHVLDDRLRVFFAALDDQRYGRPTYVDLSLRDPTQVVHVARRPVLDLGERGTFDDSGVTPCSVVDMNGRLALYYFGWQRAERVPYLLYVGLAWSEDGGETFRRHSPTPVLERNSFEPYLRSAASVVRIDGSLSAWYVSGVGWTEVGETTYPQYVIRSASSLDGAQWSAGGGICIGPTSDDEFGFGRPWVLRDPDRFRMWYSIRSRTTPYRIGYAESPDGAEWQRMDDQVGIARSESGWDSEMICYACVVDVGARRLMFYNGNSHGRTGFGVAELEQD